MPFKLLTINADVTAFIINVSTNSSNKTLPTSIEMEKLSFVIWENWKGKVNNGE